jgi:hypothetical protein
MTELKKPGPREEDVKTIDSIIFALYDVISGPPGERDWARDRHLFMPHARLIRTRKNPDGSTFVKVMTAEEFEADAAPILNKGFYEIEIARTTEQFGNIAHTFSTYESRNTPDEAPFARGINSIQLLHDGKRWWVTAIAWDIERAGNPLVARYLPEARKSRGQ